jgi:hypothetical protein
MKTSMKMEVHYHQQDKASLIIESKNSSSEELFGEMLLFCCFVLRLLVKFGKSNAGYALAMSLFEVSDNLKKVNDPKSFNCPKLIEHQEVPGQKQFLLNLDYSKRKINFIMDLKGFGLFKSGLDYYGVNTVLLFLSYLVKKIIDDQRSMAKLSEIIKSCAQAFTSGQLTKKNEKKMTLMIIGGVMGLE